MASVWKHPQSKYWMGCFTAADGRQLKRSTRETHKHQALAIAQAWEGLEVMGRDGYLSTEEQFRQVLSQNFERIFGKKLRPEPTVREWLERWLKTEAGAVAGSTHERYSQIVRDFLVFLDIRAELRLEGLTTDDFLAYRDHLLAGGRSERTVNQTIRKILTRPFHAAWQEGLLHRNPVSSVRHLRAESAEKGTFTPEQIARLLEVAQGDWPGLILAGYYTGARLGDLARLKWEAIDLVDRSIAFTQKKTRVKIKVPIHPELLDYLLSRSVQDDGCKPLFPRLCKMPGPGKSGLSMSFKRLMARAGIDDGVARERKGDAGRSVSRLSFHSLRHSFVSALANAGVAPELRQKLSGHLDSVSHATYSHHELETLREALGTIARLPRGGGTL
jgi:integrase